MVSKSSPQIRQSAPSARGMSGSGVPSGQAVSRSESGTAKARQRPAPKKGGLAGSAPPLMGSSPPVGSGDLDQETAFQIENTVQDEFVSGTTAVQSLVGHNTLDTDNFVSSTEKERQSFKKKAPRLFDQFQTALTNFKQADHEMAQRLARGDIELTLNEASAEGVSSVAELREKVQGLYQRSKKRWEARRAAADFAFPNAQKLRELGEKLGVRDAKQLKNYLKSAMYYHGSSDLLASQAGGRDIATTLLEKGVLA